MKSSVFNRSKTASCLELANDLLEITPLLLREIRSELRINSELRITAPQFRILASVCDGPKSNKEIACIIGVNVATISRMAQQLVDRGLLEKNQNGREICIRQSHHGAVVFDQVRSELRTSFSKRFLNLSPDERKQLQEGIRRVTRCLT